MSVRQILRIARADFRERTRSRWFLVVVVAIAYVGSAVTRGTIKISFEGGYGPAKGAEWLGITTGMTAALLSLLAGYYISGGGITLDRKRGLGPQIAASSVCDREYVLGKWFGGIALQWLLFVLLLFAAIITGLVTDIGGFSLQPLLVPIVVLAFPVALPVTAITVFFETNQYLDGSVGTALYTLGSLFLLSAIPGLVLLGSQPEWLNGFDLIGLTPVVESMEEALRAQYPNYEGMPSFGVNGTSIKQTFQWEGLQWTTPFLAARLGIAAVAVPVLSLAVLSFDRFDIHETTTGTSTAEAPPEDEPIEVKGSNPSLSFSEGSEPRIRWVRLLRGELRIALAGRLKLWLAGAFALLLAGLLLPTATARRLILPIAAIWPLPIWAQLGIREQRDHVTPFIRTSRTPVSKVLAAWGSSVIITLVIFSGLIVRMAAAGRPDLIVGPIAATVCFPAVALALGTATGSPRPFEGLLLVTWYTGSLNGFAPLDVLMTSEETLQTGTPFVALGLGVFVLVATVAVEAHRVGRLPTIG